MPQTNKLSFPIRPTGFSSEIGTKLCESAIGQAGGSCYSRAAFSSNDSKRLYFLLAIMPLAIPRVLSPLLRIHPHTLCLGGPLEMFCVLVTGHVCGRGCCKRPAMSAAVRAANAALPNDFRDISYTWEDGFIIYQRNFRTLSGNFWQIKQGHPWWLF